MESLERLPVGERRLADSFQHVPAHLQPAAYSDSHPQLAALVASALSALPTTDSLSSASAPQLLSQHYSLSLLLHHSQQALAAHSHRLPRLARTLHSADLAFCLHSHELAQGIAGVTASDVCGGGGLGGAEEHAAREERRLLVELVERQMAAQLEVMRAAYDEDEVEVDGADKENAPSDDQRTGRGDAHSSVAKPAASTPQPVSTAFIALTTPPSSSQPLNDAVPTPPGAAPLRELTHARQLLQRQHVALQLHLLSLHAQLLAEHRLSAVREHDAAQLLCLQAKAHCLQLKLQLMTAHADLMDEAAGGQPRSGGDASVWAEVLGRLEARRAEVAREVERVESTRSGYEAVASGAQSGEWSEIHVRWRDVQRRTKEKQWALKQLAV